MKAIHNILLLGIVLSAISGMASTKFEPVKVTFINNYSIIKTDKVERYAAIKDNIPSLVRSSAAFPLLQIIKEATKKVLRAFDLVMQRLQKEQLEIQAFLEGLTSEMSKLKLDDISHWVKEKKEIFDKYYAELWSIKGKIDEIKQIKEAALTQAALITRLGKILIKFEGDGFFSKQELDYIGEVYTGMLSDNLDILGSLKLLIFNNTTEMQDGKRLEMILSNLEDVNEVGQDFNAFTDKLVSITIARGREAKELDLVNEYLGIEL